LQNLSQSDVAADLAFRARVRAYHRAVREYHYPYLFADRVMDAEAVNAAPDFAGF
jgi:ABC-2 type transport system permease protein